MKSLNPEPSRRRSGRARVAGRVRRAQSRRTLALSAVALVALLAVVSATSASRTATRAPAPDAPARGPRPTSAGPAVSLPALASPLLRPAQETAPAAEAIEVFAADCETPKTTFALGERVCARASNVPVGDSELLGAFPLRKISWVNSAGFEVASAFINNASQTSTFDIPADAVGDLGDRRGGWSVRISSIFDSSQRASAPFTVRDPQNAAVDLSVVVTPEQTQTNVPAGAQVSFLIFVENKGPDAASAVELRHPVPEHTTFFALAQTGGPAFNCVNPNEGVGPSGTSLCSIASLPAGERASFTAVYLVGSNVAVGTEVGDAVTVASTTTERHQADNSSSAAYRVATTPTCTITTPADVVVDAAPGQAGAVVNYGQATGAGNCGAVSCDFPSGSLFPLGTTFVTCSNANQDVIERFTVTVNDTQTPVVTCPANFNLLETTPGAGSALAQYPAPSVADNDPNVDVSFSPPAGTVLELGTHAVTATATDISGNTASCGFEVTVVLRPGSCTITPDVANLPTVTGQCAVSVSTIPTATDSCTGKVGATSDDPRSFDAPGTYTINWKYTGADGTVVTQPQTVVVTAGSGALAVNGPAVVNVPITAGSPACSVEIDDLGAVLNTSVTGSCADIDVTRAVSPAAPDNVFLAGVNYTVVTTVTNGTSTASVTQTLRVIDGLNPTVTAPADAAYECLSQVPAAHPSQATAADNCGAANVAVSETTNGGAGTAASPLVITRTYTATDASGRTASDAQVITVADATAPVISCPANIVVHLPPDSPAVSMPVNFAAPTATDNCGTPAVAVSRAPGSVFPAGTTTVTATADDGRGNTSSCSFTVTVLYNFEGFFAPVGNLPTFNQVNAGRAIPVKFSLDGNKGLGIFAADHPASQQINCNSSAPVSELVETLSAGGSSLSYDASSDRYNYVWKTESAWAGTCRQLVVKLNDGSTHTALFKFK